MLLEHLGLLEAVRTKPDHGHVIGEEGPTRVVTDLADLELAGGKVGRGRAGKLGPPGRVVDVDSDFFRQGRWRGWRLNEPGEAIAEDDFDARSRATVVPRPGIRNLLRDEQRFVEPVRAVVNQCGPLDVDALRGVRHGSDGETPFGQVAGDRVPLTGGLVGVLHTDNEGVPRRRGDELGDARRCRWATKEADTDGRRHPRRAKQDPREGDEEDELA